MGAEVLLENRWQARKVRWIAIASNLWVIGWLYWAWLMAQYYGLDPGDGGVLRPPAERYAMAAAMVLIGVLPFAGMVVYCNLYLTRIERNDDRIAVTELGFLWPRDRQFRRSDFVGAAQYEGRMGGRIPVNAPWITLRVVGRALPYVIDLQAERINPEAIRALMKHRP